MTIHTQSGPTRLLEEGMIINDKWEILSFIARGGKGEVYLARQMNLDRKVALKVMSQAFLQSLEGDADEIDSELKRFQREVRVMARMQHPNIINVYDFDRVNLNGTDMDYIVMEYIPGPTLRMSMPTEGLGQDEVRVRHWIETYFLPILTGMRAVHDKGVVHRDMKPENVLIGEGAPKIMDFGIAGGYNLDNVTQTHHMIGTITYMPEEQFVDLAQTDGRVDVYALGKILYEVVEGKMKKGRDKPFKQVCLNAPASRFFKQLDRIVRQATSQNRNERIPTMKDFKRALEALFVDSAPKERQASHHYLAWAVVVAVALLGVGLMVHFDPMGFRQIPSAGMDEKQRSVEEGPSVTDLDFPVGKATQLSASFEKLPGELVASDNVAMVLVPGGAFDMPLEKADGQGETQSRNVTAFYMDKTKVTDYLYVRFLEELGNVEVRRGSVFWKGKLLLLLGEVSDGYEPIVNENGRLRVKPEDISKPVVRVTPMGAWAYARFYGKTLPLIPQWWFAASAGGGAPVRYRRHHRNVKLNSAETNLKENVGAGADIVAVEQTRANTLGIRGLRQNVHEWTITRDKGEPTFFIHGLDNTESYLKRQPWEAFSNVGFRTVFSVEVPR